MANQYGNNVFEYLNTDATAWTFTGTWNAQTPSAPNPASSATYNLTTTANDTATLNFTGRSLYLNLVPEFDRGAFTCTLDGVLLPNIYDCGSTRIWSNNNNPHYQTLTPIARNLSDGPHTAVFKCIQRTYGSGNGKTGLAIDSALVISGPKSDPKPNVLQVCGDSNSETNGCFNKDNNWPFRLAGWLAQQKGISGGLTFITPDGVPGSTLPTNNSTGSLLVGGCYEVFHNIPINRPQFVTFMYGCNDLRGSYNGTFGDMLAMDFLRYYTGMLCFLEDSMNVANMNIVVASPTYMHPVIMYNILQNGGSTGAGLQYSGYDNYEVAVSGLRNLCLQFSWVRYAPVYETMSRRSGLIMPNGAADNGVHINELGHGDVLEVIKQAMLRDMPQRQAFALPTMMY